ncbi:MAG: hypothetical protein JW779_06760 [Candidatus Thorarchaeota archaeon]|nr:hypothetical protein [Candidatus Thorarchaeota archaeon]
MNELAAIAKSIVSNLHQSYIYRVLADWQKKDALEIREELQIVGFSEVMTNPFEILNLVKKHILYKALDNDDIVEFLMAIPSWVGFRQVSETLETGEQAILTGKRNALAMLWLMILPKVSISPTTLPSEIEKQHIEILVDYLLRSDESRADLSRFISLELVNRGISDEFFDISGIVRGLSIDETIRTIRLRSLVSLILMKACDFPFDLDLVFSLQDSKLVEETTLYIIAMHAQTSLTYQIAGSGSSKPFDWPLVGTARVFTRLIATLDVLRRAASQMTTCSLYTTQSQGITESWTEWDYLSFLVKKITDYYNDLLRSRFGKGKNEELDAFINLLNGENIEITNAVKESDDRALMLYEEFTDCKRRARIGEKPHISPERRFRVVLTNLKQHLGESKTDTISSEELIEEIVEAFNAISDLIEKHTETLGNQVDKFTEELCFETSFRILELTGIGSALVDLPWVSRFIAEEVARAKISQGEIDSLGDQYRMRRIVSAFSGGVVYLVLQSRK